MIKTAEAGPFKPIDPSWLTVIWRSGKPAAFKFHPPHRDLHSVVESPSLARYILGRDIG